MVAEVAAREQVHDEVQVLPVLEGVVHIDQERMMLELGEDAPLAHDRLDAPLRQDPCLAHLLHGKHLNMLQALVLYLPHLAKAAFADAFLVLEQVLAHS